MPRWRRIRKFLEKVYRNERTKLGIVFVANLVVIGATVFYEEIRTLPIECLILLSVGGAAILTLVAPVADLVRAERAVERMESETRDLKTQKKGIEADLDELKRVIVSFLEHTEIYRERVKEYLRLGEDYLCVVKSSEGLSKAWNLMEEKERLPFGAFLARIEGSVKPFERFGLFLIPFASLPGITGNNIKEYFTKNVIPGVQTEREAFIARLSPKAAKTAEEFSYKYAAFPIRRGSIAFDTLNRKFNREFSVFIVAHQDEAAYDGMKDVLEEMVKGKEILALADWSSFASLNNEQRALIKAKKLQISDKLKAAGIDGLVTLAETSPERFRDVVWPVIYRRSTKIKALNIGKQVVAGAGETVRVLRKHGVSI